jgi:hypothetical protein
MGVKQIVDVLGIANNDLPALEERFNEQRNEIDILQFRKPTSAGNLYQSRIK